jgi:colicin import membrane protein
MDIRPRDLLAALGAHIAVALVLWLTQIFHPIPETLEVMEVVFVEPAPDPTPAPPQPTARPTPAPTPPPTPAPTPRATPPPPDPAVELKKFTDAIVLKMDCGNLDAMRAEAARGATAEQRRAANRLIQQKLDACNREAEEKRKQEEEAERKRQEEAERKRQEEAERQRREEEQRRREELQKQIEEENRQREIAEQQARQAALEAQLRAEQEAINQGIINRAGSRWAGEVQAAIRPNMRLPPGTSRDLAVRIFVRVTADGSILEARIAESSGVQAFDIEMQRALERTNPLPPISERLLAEQILREGIILRLVPQ